MDIQTISAIVGERIAVAGSEIQVRLSKLCSLVVANILGRYAESTQNNHTFFVSNAVAGVAPGTVLSNTPPISIYNPPNSNVNLSINQVFLGYVSGTLGAGTMLHAWVPQGQTLPTGGTELAPVPGLLSLIKPKFRAFTGATLAAVPSIIRPSIIMGAALASSVAFPQAPAYDELDGSIIIPPGACWVYQMIGTAGTTPLVCIGVHVEEIPVQP